MYFTFSQILQKPAIVGGMMAVVCCFYRNAERQKLQCNKNGMWGKPQRYSTYIEFLSRVWLCRGLSSPIFEFTFDLCMPDILLFDPECPAAWDYRLPTRLDSLDWVLTCLCQQLSLYHLLEHPSGPGYGSRARGRPYPVYPMSTPCSHLPKPC